MASKEIVERKGVVLANCTMFAAMRPPHSASDHEAACETDSFQRQACKVSPNPFNLLEEQDGHVQQQTQDPRQSNQSRNHFETRQVLHIIALDTCMSSF